MPNTDQLAHEQVIAERKANLHNRLLHLSTDRISEVSTDAAIDIVKLRTSQALDALTHAINAWQHDNLAA